MTNAIEPARAETTLGKSEHERPATIFDGDPRVVVAVARDIAKTLAAIIEERELSTTIGKSEHVRIEGWTTLGAMLGVFAEIESSAPLYDENGRAVGWEARALARTLAGRVIGSADGMTTRAEYKWRNADDYAIRSMAQTRAAVKALKLPLGWIIELSGFSATPAEEMPPGEPPARKPRSADEYRKAIEELKRAHNVSDDVLRLMAEQAGVKDRASLAQLRVIHDRLLIGAIPDFDVDDLPPIPATVGESDATDDPTDEPATAER